VSDSDDIGCKAPADIDFDQAAMIGERWRRP
jgi:hypothetical protein